jgi:chromosome segregation ATPase
MNAMLERLKIEGDSIHSYLKNIDFLRSSKKEIETEMRMLETQKIRIEQIENELARATNVCDLINKRTDELHDKINLISSIDHKLIEISRIQEEMDLKLGEIRQANSKITEITQAVQNTNRLGNDLYEKMQKLYRELEKLELKEQELQDQMNHTEERASELAARSLDVKSIESKFDKVENLMMDLSTKHKQIATLQKRIENLKLDSEEIRQNMEGLLVEAEEKYQKLFDLLNHAQANIDTPLSASPKQKGKPISEKQATEAKTSGESEMMKRKRATVLNLYHNYSWTSETIAQKLNMEKSLVEAIIRES